MSSLAAAKADNFYYPPDFDPQKHHSLNKYNGQHPLRERASKLDQGILVIRFEMPFNIWCEKCGEHIAKGERFNAEKKAIGQYHSTKVLQFAMTHHCGCKITIQTDPKRAEYLVVEGARKKEESYRAADAEVIELPDDEERERRDKDLLYRLEYQQGAKAKALTEMERLAAIHDVADARAADPYSLNRAMRAALRSEKRAVAALDARRAELGLPEELPLLAQSEGDVLAAQLAFLTSSARAAASAEATRKRILEQDIFTSALGANGSTGSDPVLAVQPPSKRPALNAAAPGVKLRTAARPPAAPAPGETHVESGDQVGPSSTRQQAQRPREGQELTLGKCVDTEEARPVTLLAGVATAARTASTGWIAGAQSCAGAKFNVVRSSHCGNDAGGSAQRADPTCKPAPGAGALAVAAARAAGLPQAHGNFTTSSAARNMVHRGAVSLVRLSGAKHALGRPLADVPVSGMAAAPKRSLKDRAAQLLKRQQGLGG
ncbi:hypothetical protein Vretimale_16293 [Volvox reticuliferus]|uniref:Uncharacterized protein n=1 Tax=Volvox reticuliferus TaxID=1737510 RepID=A0A8J4CSG0_9CHLO|nr:hypothetical protein Vretifemale_16899 [Volvox reticuliferus]GIM13071.1 hypothetical protein Vretimale_16293 [Volvox reticuliferus]